MPTVDGTFVPRRWRPLTGNLFDVIPPDDPDDSAEPTMEDWDWYHGLRRATAEILVYIVDNVRTNYTRHRGVSFSPRIVRGLHTRCRLLAHDFLDNDLTYKDVSDTISRMAKQFGLIVYSTEDGPRRNWPRPGREHFTLDDAQEIVDQALHGRWPSITGKESTS